ncbi:ATP-binding protein [Vibrio sp. 10N.261.55.A7]|uniref:ATP-binding protein n=1 Tax=Vibrio sp. 10N.261.55.A7 TaxID=1880851 RepID=UPI000C82D05F|nr:ATP-binding protein [Vibrio sp. 10N.261.55.A7]PMJ92476.1 hybrid sensor histidine kinase/response regulator [Vibrio sp. 10N.261.55.A7]
MSGVSPIERKLSREIAARKEAEQLLEKKGLELYEANQQLTLALKQLEKQNQKDMRKFEFEQQIDEVLIQFGRSFLSRHLDDALLSSFLTQLSSSNVIDSVYLNIAGTEMPALDLEDFECVEHKRQDALATEVRWQNNFLFLPLRIGRAEIGELVFVVIVGDVNKDFIVSQVRLVGELLCSALSRQIMINETLDAKTRAEDSERATKEFVAMINHELRTPLNGLLGSVELMADTPLDEVQTSYLGNLTQSGDLLRTIINDLLDFSKMNAGMMELIPSEFSWTELEQMLKGIFAPKALEKRIEFSIERETQVPSNLIGDVERISQILVNLVGNAIKFTSEGWVKLEVSWQGNQLAFKVVDTGIGIEQKKQATLFDPFVQADSSSKRNFEGTGLGLAICKQLIELMDGNLSLKSELNKGSTFRVSLPLEVAKEAEDKSRKESTQTEVKSLEGLEILVVDDIRMNQIIINQMLKKFDLVADIGGNGIEAINAVENKEYDIIFMDCRMPEMDGFEATSVLRQQGYQKPIIALTAGTTLEERELCIESGMDDILTKPYTASGLQQMISKWV